MPDSGGRKRSHVSPTSLAQEQGKGDRIVGAVLLAGFCAFCAAAITWMIQAKLIWQILAGLAGGLGGFAVASCKPFWTAGSQASLAFRRATEEYDGPGRLGEAIQGALDQRKSFLAWRVASQAIVGALLGVAAGGLIFRRFAMPLVWLLGGALGAAAGTGLALAQWSATTVLTVLIVRTVGLPFGYAIIGGLSGAIFGMELWRRWWHVAWPNLGALALGIPMALLFALAGRERSRLKLERTRNGK